MRRMPKCIGVVLLCAGFTVSIAQAQSSTNAPPPTPEEAKKFIETAEQRLFDLGVKAQRASWVQENFITVDTEQIAADAGEEANGWAVETAKQAHRFDGLKLSAD